MYDKFYQFSRVPFHLTPDSRCFFGSSGHSRAMAHLVYGLSQEEGFIVITGEVGAGKTTLVEPLCSQLDRQAYLIARIAATSGNGTLLSRVAVLEQTAARQERVFRRLLDLPGAEAEISL